MAQVFISHSSLDKEQTSTVVTYLESKNISCWVSYRDIPPGADFGDLIPQAIRECHAFVILLSRNSVASADVAKELSLATRKSGETEKVILPLLMEDISLPDRFDYHLVNVQAYRYYTDPAAAMENILRELQKVLPDEGPMPQMDDCTAEKCYHIAEQKFMKGDFKAAAQWYKCAVEQLFQQLPQQEQIIADAEVTEWYQKGLECCIAENYREAVEWFRKAGERGHAYAQFRLGLCFQNGNGVPQDLQSAVTWYQKAAEQGIAAAQNTLGVCYNEGTGVPQDYATAVMWYRNAAEQGYAAAQYNLSLCYTYGKGVRIEPYIGMKWCLKAAEQGHASAQFNMGIAYSNGNHVQKNSETAVMWFMKAANQGHVRAQLNMGVCYYMGDGVPLDYESAVKWYRIAAENGNSTAQYLLGRCCENGVGTDQDNEAAARWYQKSAEQGNLSARSALKKLQ